MQCTYSHLFNSEYGFFRLNPLPTERELEEYYRNDYYQKSVSKTYAKKYTAGEIEHILNGACVAQKCFQDLTGKSVGGLCDVGCGEGYFVKWFADHGWKVNGCDYSEYGIAENNPTMLAHFTAGNIDDSIQQMIREEKVFDLINMSYVLEHVLQPWRILQLVRSIMHPRSVLRIEVPNDFSLFQSFLLQKKNVEQTYWVSSPDHINYFNFDSLAFFLQKSGFKVVDALTDFPIEMFLANTNSNYVRTSTAGKGAHEARIEIDNYLIRQGIEKYIEYYRAAAKLKFGRAVIFFCVLAD